MKQTVNRTSLLALVVAVDTLRPCIALLLGGLVHGLCQEISQVFCCLWCFVILVQHKQPATFRHGGGTPNIGAVISFTAPSLEAFTRSSLTVQVRTRRARFMLFRTC